MSTVQVSSPSFASIGGIRKYVVTIGQQDLDPENPVYVNVDFPLSISGVECDNCSVIGKYAISCQETSQAILASAFLKKTGGSIVSCGSTEPGTGNVRVAGIGVFVSLVSLQLYISNPSESSTFTILVSADVVVIGD